MRKYIFFLLILFSLPALSQETIIREYVGTNATTTAACEAELFGNGYTNVKQYCGGPSNELYFWVYVSQGITYTNNLQPSPTTYPDAVRYIFKLVPQCPEGLVEDPQTGQCVLIPSPESETRYGITDIGSTSDWIVDENGDIWELTDVKISDPVTGEQLNEYTKTDGNQNDPNSWPENYHGNGQQYDDVGSPDSIGTDENGNHYRDVEGTPWEQTTPIENNNPITVKGDEFESNTYNPDGTVTEKKTTYEYSSDGSTTATQKETITNTDGTKVEVKKQIVTVDGEQSEITTRTTYDAQGNVTDTQITGTRTGNNKSQEGENGTEAVAGGNDCSSPPVCTGDTLECRLILEAWRIRCGKGKSSVLSDDCTKQPDCDGDPIECAILIQQWKIDCANREDIKNLGSDSQDYFEQNGFGEYNMDNFGEGEFFDGLLGENGEVSIESQLSGAFQTAAAGACPPDVPITVPNFGTFYFSFTPFCEFAGYIRYLVILMASIYGSTIILRTLQEF